MKLLLRFFFRLLYHEFAFTYDLVAAVVSFNRWKDWVMSVLPFLAGKRILEINPEHQVFDAMNQLMAQGGNDETLKEYVGLLYNQALLLEGSKIKDPAGFAKSVSKLMLENAKK